MRSRFARTSRIAWLISLTALCQADALFASTFTVNPTLIVLSSRTRTAVLSVRNESVEPLRFHVSVFAWDQAADGQMRLTPTEAEEDSALTLGAVLTAIPRSAMPNATNRRGESRRILVQDLTG